MTKKTLLIFQLFLAIVAIYTLLDHTYNLLVPFFCLTGMFFVGRERVAFKKISEKIIPPIRKEAIAQARRTYFMCGSNSLAHRIWAGKSLANLSCKRGSLCSNCLTFLAERKWKGLAQPQKVIALVPIFFGRDYDRDIVLRA